jgi:hypothetical protein
MVDSPLDPEASGWRSPQALVAVRLATEFVLDVGQISRGDRDLADPLILTAILEANQAVVRHDPSLAQVYGSADTALPDELRRPISINAPASASSGRTASLCPRRWSPRHPMSPSSGRGSPGWSSSSATW